MGLLDFFRKPPPAPVKRSSAIIQATRGFEAGIADRLTASWKTGNQTANQEIRSTLETTRNRARDLANNNEYARKYLQLVVANVAGPSGFTLQSTINEAGKPDTLARELIEDAFEDWCQRGTCEISGRLSFADVQRAVVESWARDGEALIVFVRGNDAGAYGFALRLLEVERLPVQYSQDLKNGHKAVMGVEVDQYNRAVAYWLNLGDIDRGTSASAATLTRVEARHVLHVFRPYRPEQVRGYPSMHAVMRSLKMLDGFEEAAIVAARTGASKMGFFTTPDGDASPLSDGSDDEGNFMSDAEPGVFGVLPRGYDFKAFDPDYPHANYAAFVKNRLRSIASGLGITYHGLANDLEGVNFSSIRSGTLEERDAWMVIQSWFIDAFLRPVYSEWLKTALLTKAVTTPGGAPLPADKFRKFAAHSWLGRRWGWVDPLKDIEASRLAIQTGIASPQMIAAQAGVDVEDVLEQLAEFDRITKDIGVSVSFAAQPAPAAKEAPAPTEAPPTVP